MAEDSVTGASPELNLSTESVPELNLEEQEATKKFLENVNKWRSAQNLQELPWSSAVKFLMVTSTDHRPDLTGRTF